MHFFIVFRVFRHFDGCKYSSGEIGSVNHERLTLAYGSLLWCTSEPKGGRLDETTVQLLLMLRPVACLVPRTTNINFLISGSAALVVVCWE